MVEPQPSKLAMLVRSRSPAPNLEGNLDHRTLYFRFGFIRRQICHTLKLGIADHRDRTCLGCFCMFEFNKFECLIS